MKIQPKGFLLLYCKQLILKSYRMGKIFVHNLRKGVLQRAENFKGKGKLYKFKRCVGF